MTQRDGFPSTCLGGTRGRQPKFSTGLTYLDSWLTTRSHVFWEEPH